MVVGQSLGRHVCQRAVDGICHEDCRVLSGSVGERLSDGFRSKFRDRTGEIVDDGLSDCIS